ncbi:YjgN family protein [Roseateles sp. MS654]|uniref:YjgN family protein n=1 Tax=Roseateles sp. MS654 TaxID=3412685 RepID=UPI003C2C022E
MIDNKMELELVPQAPPAARPLPPPLPPPPSVAAPTPTPTPTSAPRSLAAARPEPLATGLLAKLHEQRLEFTGTGAAYFRVWIVNTLLTLATLGVYSAWAKRRKARWFARHTLLAGDPLDFHGDPRRILVGRILALTLLICYGHAFEWSRGAGFAMLAVLYVFGPTLFAGAQRFKLGNTSWRGVRFGFQASALTVYASCLPLLVAWTIVSVGAGMGLGPAVIGVVGLAVGLLFPLAHGWLKRFQHRHARYGELAFRFELPVRAFYGLYLRLLGVGLVGGFVAGFIAEAGFGGLRALVGEQARVLAMLATTGVLWVIGWPVYIARLQKLIWDNTRLTGGIEFAYELPAFALFKTLAGRGLLTLLTLGLYWPFLAVRIARLRIEGMTVLSDEPLDQIVVRALPPRARGALGDGVADAFGLDIGW